MARAFMDAFLPMFIHSSLVVICLNFYSQKLIESLRYQVSQLNFNYLVIFPKNLNRDKPLIHTITIPKNIDRYLPSTICTTSEPCDLFCNPQAPLSLVQSFEETLKDEQRQYTQELLSLIDLLLEEETLNCIDK